MATRKNGIECAMEEARRNGCHFENEINAAFMCGDFSHPEHDYLVKAREAAREARDYLRVAKFLYQEDIKGKKSKWLDFIHC